MNAPTIPLAKLTQDQFEYVERIRVNSQWPKDSQNVPALGTEVPVSELDTPRTFKCRRCGEQVEFGSDVEGCRDLDCPNQFDGVFDPMPAGDTGDSGWI